MTYGGVELLLIPAATAALGFRFATDVPANLADVVPLGQIQAVGGPASDEVHTFQSPTVVVDVFAADRASANAQSLAVHTWMRSLPGHIGGGAVITKVQTITLPSHRPWDDTAVHKFGATYRITLQHS